MSRSSPSFSFPNGIDLSSDGRTLYVGESESTQSVFAGFPLNPNRLRAIDLDSTFEINAGRTGAWYDPRLAGQGFLLDVIESSNQLFLAWFTFAASSTQKIGSPNHRWLTAQGAYRGDRASLEVTLTEGGQFSESGPVQQRAAGTIDLKVTGCTAATLTYTLPDGESGVLDLVRLTPDVFCETVVP